MNLKTKALLRNVLKRRMSSTDLDLIFEDRSEGGDYIPDYKMNNKNSRIGLTSENFQNYNINHVIKYMFKDDSFKDVKEEKLKEYKEKYGEPELIPGFWRRYFFSDFLTDENDMKLSVDMSIKINPTIKDIMVSFDYNCDKSYEDLLKILDYYSPAIFYKSAEDFRDKFSMRILENFDNRYKRFELMLLTFSSGILLKSSNFHILYPSMFKMLEVKDEQIEK